MIDLISGKPKIFMVGASSTVACGVTDQAKVLQEALVRAGLGSSSKFFRFEVSGTFLSQLRELRLWFRELEQVIKEEQSDWLLWHYTSFSYCHRGIPVFLPFWMRCLARTRIPVVLFLHEIAYPFGRRGWRGFVQAVTQRIALIPLLFFCEGAIVTTEDRREWVRSCPWLPRVPVTFVPVCSNLPEVPKELLSEVVSSGTHTVGVFGFRQETSSPTTVISALSELCAEGLDVKLVLAGAPGPGSPPAGHWLAAAEQEGFADAVSFTGLLSPTELIARLKEIEVFVLADTQGPSTGMSTLAALLSLGRAVVAVDGPRRSTELVEAGAVTVVGSGPGLLTEALRRLLSNSHLRIEQGERAANWYTDSTSSAVVAGLIVEFLQQLESPSRE